MLVSEARIWTSNAKCLHANRVAESDWVNGCLMKWSEFTEFRCFLPVVQGAEFNGKSTGTTTVSVLQMNSSSSHSLCHSTWEWRIGCFHYEKHNHGPETWTWWSSWSLCFTQKNKSFWVYFPQSACLNLSRYGQPRLCELFFQMVWRMCEFKEGDSLMQCLLHFTEEVIEMSCESERWHCGHHHLKFIKTSFGKQVWNI